MRVFNRKKDFVLGIAGSLLLAASALAGKPKAINFAGRLVAIDRAASTITLRGKKTFLFHIDPHRCEINRNGYYFLEAGATRGGLSDAKIGDAVVGKLSLAGPEPVVVQLFLMAKPKYGRPVANKPGFVTSPYPAIGVLSHTSTGMVEADVRGFPRGTMILDPATGKIFLVP